MKTVIDNDLNRIISICKKMQVESLFLIGSGARVTDFTAESDLDFVFKFKKNESGLPIGGFDYFDLLFKLEEVTGKKVDLISEEKIKNRFFLDRINKEKICIYES